MHDAVRQVLPHLAGVEIDEVVDFGSNSGDVGRSGRSFSRREVIADGTTIFTYHNTASNSGGEQEKLVAQRPRNSSRVALASESRFRCSEVKVGDQRR